MAKRGTDDNGIDSTSAAKPAVQRGSDDTATLPLLDDTEAGATEVLDAGATEASGDTATEAAGIGIEGPIELPDRFEIKGRLGRGGMAVVLRVHDRALGRDVAVKLLLESMRWDKTMRTRFLREARAAATLRHPGLVTVHDIDADNGFIVMELVSGESLRDRLRRSGKLPPAEVRRIGATILDALAVAHAAGIVHRDVKPANVLLSDDEEVKLADFGIASFGDSDLTTTGSHVGTPAYMSPEQLRGRSVDARADIYSTGATLFEAATGRKFHTPTETVEDPYQVVADCTQDRALAAAISAALREKLEDRYADVTSFAAVLADSTREHLLRSSTERGASRQRTFGTVMLGVLLMTALVTGLLMLRDRGNGEEGVSLPGSAAASSSIALLPFADETGNPRLDFATSGLPHLMGMEMRRIPEASVIGYYRLLEHVSGPDATAAEWIESARALGARTLVRGRLANGAHGIHVEVTVESGDGSIVTRLSRDVSVEEVPEAVRALAVEVAGIALGRTPDVALRAPRTLDVERGLQLGIAAVERHDLARAEAELKAVIHEDPSLGEARYYLAMAFWWRGAPSEEVLAEVAAALDGDLDDAHRGFLEGMRLLVQWRAARAVEHFRKLAEQYPENRDILYGLFEALYHAGHVADSVAVYRTVCELSPRFRLGLVHALTYYTARTDEKGMEWALARAGRLGDPPRDVWGAKVLVSRRDHAAAIELMRKVSASPGGAKVDAVARLATLELVRAYAVNGQIDLALALVPRLAGSFDAERVLSMRGLHTIRGDPEARKHWREEATRAATMRPAGFPRVNGWIEVLLLEPPSVTGDELKEIEDAIADAPAEVSRMQFHQLGRAFLAGARGDEARLAVARESVYPEVAAVAEAFIAERKGDLEMAASWWSRAAASAGNGRFLPHEYFGLARVKRSANDHEATFEACREVIEPRLFDWSWASRVCTCLLWTGEAAEALGRFDAARDGYERLVAMRSAAAEDDSLTSVARARLEAIAAR